MATADRELDLEIPLLSGGEGDSTDDEASGGARAVIAETLHSTHADMTTMLNFALLYPRLNQAGILPADSLPSFMCPMVPDHTTAQVNNLIMSLPNCSLEQFSNFIALVRETKGEGGEAHEQLAEVLQKNFDNFRNSRNNHDLSAVSKKKSMIRGHHGLSGDGHLVMEVPAIRRCDCCNRKWKDWNCKFWFVVHTLCWSFVVVSSLSLFLFFAHYPGIEASGVTPTHIVGNNILLVDTGDSNLGWAAKLRVGIADCAGTVYVLRGTNCSILTEARIEDPRPLRYWAARTLRFFLEDSHLSINFSGGFHTFAVLKSYAAHKAYLDLCESLGDIGRDHSTCHSIKTLPYLCADNSTLSPLLVENTWCYKHVQAVTFPMNESDFYSLILNSDTEPTIRGVNYIYNQSILHAYEDTVEYNISSSQGVGAGSYAWLPISSSLLSFAPWNNCVVLQSLCSAESTADVSNNGSEVDYLFERRHDVLIYPSLFLFVCMCVALSMVACHVGCIRRRNRRVERERDHGREGNTENNDT